MQEPRNSQKRIKYGLACYRCKNAHKACDGRRPCSRCLTLDPNQCKDAPLKMYQQSFEPSTSKTDVFRRDLTLLTTTSDPPKSRPKKDDPKSVKWKSSTAPVKRISKPKSQPTVVSDASSEPTPTLPSPPSDPSPPFLLPLVVPPPNPNHTHPQPSSPPQEIIAPPLPQPAPTPTLLPPPTPYHYFRDVIEPSPLPSMPSISLAEHHYSPPPPLPSPLQNGDSARRNNQQRKVPRNPYLPSLWEENSLSQGLQLAPFEHPPLPSTSTHPRQQQPQQQELKDHPNYETLMGLITHVQNQVERVQHSTGDILRSHERQAMLLADCTHPPDINNTLNNYDNYNNDITYPQQRLPFALPPIKEGYLPPLLCSSERHLAIEPSPIPNNTNNAILHHHYHPHHHQENGGGDFFFNGLLDGPPHHVAIDTSRKRKRAAPFLLNDRGP